MTTTYTLSVTLSGESDDDGRIILSALYLAQRSVELYLAGRAHESSVVEARERSGDGDGPA